MSLAAEQQPARPVPMPVIGLPGSAETMDSVIEGPWMIHDEPAAEWAMRLLARAEASMAEHRAQHAEWTQQLADWLEQVTKADARTVEAMTGKLAAYALRLREKDATVKSVKLPSGVIKTRVAGGTVSIEDQDALIAWARQNLTPEAQAALLRVSVRVSDLKDITAVLDVPEAVQLTCGCVLFPEPDAPRVQRIIADTGETEWAPWEVGLAVVCGVHGPALIGSLHGIQRSWVVDLDDMDHVPGVAVLPRRVQATVQVTS